MEVFGDGLVLACTCYTKAMAYIGYFSLLFDETQSIV